MLRIFLTADAHIGLKYASHRQAAVLAQARTEAFGTMVELADREGCQLFVIAGDLFENVSTVGKKEVKAVVELLSRFGGMVVVLPGNHDYYTPDGKVWQYFLDAAAPYDNILVMTEYRPYALELSGQSVTLYPALCTARHSAPGENNLGWIKELEFSSCDGYRIGVAHGALEGETIDSEGRYYLMTRKELEAIPMDLWLLGHTHVPFPRLAECVGERIFNAGTPVQTDVTCDCEGQSFILELDEMCTVHAKLVPTGTVRFVRKTVNLSAGEMEDRLDRALSELDDNTVVELILTGAVQPEEYEDRHRVLEKKLSRFLEGSYRDGGLSRSISKALIEAEYPETSLSARLLTALLDRPKEAQLMYELLQELKETMK